MKSSISFLLLFLMMTFTIKGQTIEGPTNVDVGKVYTYYVNYKASSNPMTIVFKTSASHGEANGAVWDTRAEKYAFTVKWTSATNNASITATATTVLAQAHKTGIKVNQSKPPITDDKGDWEPNASLISIEGPDVIVSPSMTHYDIYHHGFSSFKGVEYLTSRFTSPSQEFPFGSLHNISIPDNTYPQRDITSQVTIRMIDLNYDRISEAGELLMLTIDRDLKKGTNSRVKSVRNEKRIIVKKLMLRCPEHVNLGDVFTCHIENIDLFLENDIMYAGERAGKSIKWDIPKTTSRQTRVPTPYYEIIEDDKIGSIKLKAKVPISCEGSRSRPYPCPEISATVFNIDKKTGELLPPYLVLPVVSLKAHVGVSSPRRLSTGSASSSGREAEMKAHGLFSVKLYTLNSTREVYSAKDLQYFNINETNLAPGIYIMEEIYPNGEIFRAKVSKSQYY